MKKLVSLALVFLMALGCMGTSFAAVSPVGVTAHGWNGWSGNATTVTSPDNDASRGMVMEITGDAVMNPAKSFRGVIMLTVDVNAPNGGSIKLTDAAGRDAGTITLADGKINGEAAYVTSSWNTLKLFAMTGTNSYEIYSNDGTTDTLVAKGTTTEAVIPTRVKFTTTDTMYVDNVTIEEMHKKAAYTSNEIKNIYTLDLTEGVAGDAVHGVDNWTATSNDASFGAYNANYIVAEKDGEKVIKLEKKNSTGTSLSKSINHLKHSVSASNNIVIEASVYAEAGNTSSFKWLIDGINLFTMKNGELVFGAPAYTKANVYEENSWVDIKIELMKESQSMNFYIGTEKINDVPVYVGSFSSFSTLDIYVNPAVAAEGVWYLKNLKISELTATNEITVFSEDFNGDTNKLVHAGSTNYLSLTNAEFSGYTTKSGRLQDYSYTSTNNVITNDEGTAVTTGTNKLAAANDEYYYAPVDLSSAEKVVVKFSWYNAKNAHQKTASGAVRDRLFWGLGNKTTGTINYGATMQPASPYMQWTVNSKTKDVTNTSFNYQPTPSKMSITYDVTQQYPINCKIGTAENNWTTAITWSDVQEQDALIFYLNKNYGGAYYLDDITVTKTMTVLTDDYYKNNYVASENTHTDTITRDNLPEIALSEVVFKASDGTVAGIPQDNGTVSSVKIEKNADLTGKNLLVAVYDGNVLSDCAVVPVTSKTEYDLTANNIKTTAASVVKVFCLGAENLVPQMEAKSVDKDERVQIFLAGDSIVEDYTKRAVDCGRHSWGMSLVDLINPNFAEIKNYAESGETAKSFAGKSGYTNIVNQIGKGDYLLISFATNDSGTTSSDNAPYGEISDGKSFQYYLYEKYIKLALDNGATPILVTTNPRSQTGNYDSKDRYTRDSVYPYVQAMRKLAAECKARGENVGIVDLYAMSVDYLDEIGFEAAKPMYFASIASEYGYTENDEEFTDYTHLTKAGADKAAEFLAQGLKLIDGIKDLVK